MKGRFALAAALLLLSLACRPGRPARGPGPDRLESLRGQASIRHVRGGQSGRARLAFLLLPPGRAFLEAFDPLNRTIFQVAVEGEEATLLVPRRRAYWAGARAEVLEAGLGFPLAVGEMAEMLSGRWPGGTAGWELDRDGQGRVAGGRREGFSFRVDEFFPRRGVPRRIGYASAAGSGSLSVSSLGFNDPAAGAGLPPLRIPSAFIRLTRAEMERLLRDAD